GERGVGLRPTVWDQLPRRVVQGALAVLALALLGTPLTGLTPIALALLAVFGVGAWLLMRIRRTANAWVGGDLRTLARLPAAGRITLASLGSTAGHVAVFLVAVHAVGVDASWGLQVAAALVVLVGSAIP